MTVHYKTQGFVFKKEDRLDADRVFSVFTRDFGKVDVFGKAIRKINSKLKGGMEVFYVCDIEFIQGKSKKTLTDALAVEKFRSISENPEKLRTAHRISNILHNFIKGEQKDEHILSLILDSFEKINRSQNVSLAFYYFFWNFISVLGYAPELSKCVVCAQGLTPAKLHFSNKEGGLTCQNCHAKKEGNLIDANVVKVLRLIIKKDWDVLSKLKMHKFIEEALEEVSRSYYTYLVSTHSRHE